MFLQTSYCQSLNDAVIITHGKSD